MSKDIRSFFVVKNPKNDQKNTSSKPNHETTKKHGQKKRSLVIIDSDSEDELNSVKTKRNKPSVESINIKIGNSLSHAGLLRHKKQTSSKKPEVAETKSKYFETHNVSATDIFGDEPIKRDTSRKIVKKSITKEDKEFHVDKDLEAELLKLDDIGSDIFPKEESMKSNEVNKNVTKDSSDKVSPQKQEEIISRLSPRKKKFNSDHNESSRKRIKLENEQSSSDHNEQLTNLSEKSPKIPNSRKQESPFKSSQSTLSSPEKTPTKKSPFNKSPLKNKVPPSVVSPFKNLSLTRTKKEDFPTENLSKINGDITCHAKQTDDSRIEVPSKIFPKTEITKEVQIEKEISSKQTLKSAGKDSFYKSNDKFKNEIGVTSSVNTELTTATLLPSNLWVERYKPTETKQIIGQQGEKSCVKKLLTWLKNWDKNHSGNKKLVKPSPWAKNDDGAFFKAALLSGPPGVGKTTTAHLVSKELGFDVVEFNASDTRSKKLLHQEVSELLSTKSLSPFFTGKGDQVTKKHVLLMDEVDGMAGNEDRGGMQELITLIKQSHIPVICMCNDRNHPKIRSLANYCFDLRFSKPRVEQIKGAMLSVCYKEKLKLTPDSLTDIISSANQDIRLIMNHLSMLSIENTNLANSTKHIKLGPWDIVRKIFSEEEHKSMSIYDKCDLFFHDYSITPLFVQENYLNAVPHKPESKNKIKKMELFAKAAKSLSYGDLTEKSIRSNNAWGLLPVQAIFSSLIPGEVLEGHLGAQINFPSWFGKNSRQTKMNRLIQELTVHSRLKISGNREAMNLDYLSPLESSIVTPLLRDGADGVTQALSVLSEYCLVREDMDSIAELCSWPNTKNRFAEVDSKVKAAFTRAYNKTSVPTPYAAIPIKKGSRADVDAMDIIEEEEEEANTQDMEDDEEEEGLDTDAMILVKKKPAGKKADKEVQPSTSKGGKTSKRGRKK